MRIPSWLVGLLGFSGLLFATGVCAVLTFSTVRGAIVDLWDSGVQVQSPAEVLDVLTNPQAFRSTPTAPVIALQASATPAPVLPTETPQEGVTAATQDAIATPDTSMIQPPTEMPAVDSAIEPNDPNDQYRWNDPRQIRILLMGIDQRLGFDTDRAYRTDTIILITVDPVRKTVGVVNFPRDLWVNIPNFQANRINTANFLGDNAAYPGGGSQLVMETVSANFGVPVNRYIRVNFTAFEAIVNALAPNGVELCVKESIYDPKYPDEGYGTLEVRFDIGCQRLNATRLLQYARTRATYGGDIDRARRQQEVLDAMRAEILSAGGVANFLGQIPNLWQALNDSYKTNLTLDEIISLGFLMGEIERANITFAVIDNNYVDLGLSPDGQDILIPQAGRIANLLQRIVYPQQEIEQADIITRAQAENAVIRVFNGTSTAGLAGNAREWLTGRGVTITDIGNAPAHAGAPTVIKDYGNNRWTAQWLASLMGLSQDRIQPGTDGLAASGIVIVVGPDIQTIISR